MMFLILFIGFFALSVAYQFECVFPKNIKNFIGFTICQSFLNLKVNDFDVTMKIEYYFIYYLLT